MGRNKEILLGKKRHASKKSGALIRKIQIWSFIISLIFFAVLSVKWMEKERRIKQAQIDISRIAHAVRLFRVDFGRCPSGVEELTIPPEGAPYISPVSDPWGRSYKLECPAKWDQDDVDVISSGPDPEISKDNIKSLVLDMNL
ncbi:MAG: type II secretion system protein GspG [Deltaproteobacteria bacterium]|nr:type II secretion system protein GspG [Deltaproteobacteria bacterium]